MVELIYNYANSSYFGLSWTAIGAVVIGLGIYFRSPIE